MLRSDDSTSDNKPTWAERLREWGGALLRGGLKLILPFAVVVFFIVGLGVAQRLGWLATTGGDVAVAPGTEQVLHICPMHPDQRKMGPGKCPICGMPLEPQTTTGPDVGEYAVHIKEADRRLVGIRTAPALSLPVYKTIEVVGKFRYDESQVSTVTAYFGGRIEDVYADYTGVEIDKGDHLAVLYSPELYAAQVEYLEARKAVAKGGTLPVVRQTNERLARNARRRLVEFNMTPEQIRELETSGEAVSRLTIYSPQSGTVIQKDAIEGRYVEAGSLLYQVADLDLVWLMLELFPEDAALIRFGQTVQARVQSLPGETFTGRVAFIDPVVSEQTRTVNVRVEFENTESHLRPGDYASATIRVPLGDQGQVYDAELAGKYISPMHPQIIRDQPGNCPVCGMPLVPTTEYGYSETPVPQPEVTIIPRNAVLAAGSESVAYVEIEPGVFEIRPLTLGRFAMADIEGEAEAVAVIQKGIDVGEMVAKRGTFLIDSQMQLSGKPSVIDPSRAKRRPPKVKPLEKENIDVRPIPGESGRQLEQLYSAYLSISDRLAADKSVTQQQVEEIQTAVEPLSKSDALTQQQRDWIAELQQHTEHLHHMALPKAREVFRPISLAVTKLAFEVRGEQAETSFDQHFCPMTPSGGADWLQAGGERRNPYFGSQMLRCGELIRTLPPSGKPQTPAEPPPEVR